MPSKSTVLQTLGYLAPTGTIPTGPITGLSGSLAGTTYLNAGGNKNIWCAGGLAAVFVQITPSLTLSRNFASLLGFSNIFSFNAIPIINGGYSPLPTIFTSNVTPVISPVNSYIMTCSLINSPYSVPINVFYTIPLSVAIGNMVLVSPSQFILNDTWSPSGSRVKKKTSCRRAPWSLVLTNYPYCRLIVNGLWCGPCLSWLS